ncbi:hypothetical protein HHI36_009951 [Cryptolaemus montrouzieri]|uniref:Uncharacterized protein n=1 Tax=Cryptolaemus montrouzieri TaxID=559131 RepID=A0ABD2MHF6_9CUCU
MRNEKPSRRLKSHIRKIYRKIGTNTKHPDHKQHNDVYMDTLKQKLQAKAKRLSRYVKRTERKHQNQGFLQNAANFHKGNNKTATNNNREVPDAQCLTDY